MSADGNEKWVLGVFLGLLESIAINTGNNIQSLGLQRLEQKKKEKTGSSKKKPFVSTKTVPESQVDDCSVPLSQIEERNTKPCSSTTWLIGTAVFVAGSLIDFISYAFAAQSLLASLESVQFVTNLLFGRFMLGANVTSIMLIGTGLTALGTVLSVQFSSKQSLDLSLSEMKELYLNPAYIVYLVFVGGLLVFLNFIYHFYDKKRQEGSPLKYTSVIVPLAYSIWSALFGTQSVVQAKLLAELLALQTAGEENVFESWFTYLTFVLWALTGLVWLVRLNDALVKFDPLFIIPLLQCSFIFFAIVSGGIFFKEFNTFTAVQWFGFWGGVLVMFSGLTLQSPRLCSLERQEGQNPTTSIKMRSDLDVECSQTSTINDGNEKKVKQRNRDPSINNTDDALCIKSGYAEEDLKHDYIARSSLSKTVRDFMVEGAKEVVSCSSMLLIPHNSTGAMTCAMVAATANKETDLRRREHLRQLRFLLAEHLHVSGEVRLEILELVRELGLDTIDLKDDSVDDKSNVSPVPTCDMLTPRSFKSVILRKASDLEMSMEASEATEGGTPMSMQDHTSLFYSEQDTSQDINETGETIYIEQA